MTFELNIMIEIEGDFFIKFTELNNAFITAKHLISY